MLFGIILFLIIVIFYIFWCHINRYGPYRAGIKMYKKYTLANPEIDKEPNYLKKTNITIEDSIAYMTLELRNSESNNLLNRTLVMYPIKPDCTIMDLNCINL
jgi:hypothetical protein